MAVPSSTIKRSLSVVKAFWQVRWLGSVACVSWTTWSFISSIEKPSIRKFSGISSCGGSRRSRLQSAAWLWALGVVSSLAIFVIPGRVVSGQCIAASQFIKGKGKKRLSKFACLRRFCLRYLLPHVIFALVIKQLFCTVGRLSMRRDSQYACTSDAVLRKRPASCMDVGLFRWRSWTACFQTDQIPKRARCLLLRSVAARLLARSIWIKNP